MIIVISKRTQRKRRGNKNHAYMSSRALYFSEYYVMKERRVHR